MPFWAMAKHGKQQIWNLSKLPRGTMTRVAIATISMPLRGVTLGNSHTLENIICCVFPENYRIKALKV